MKNIKKAKGFTLVELVVTIAIITVLSGILVTSVSGFIEQANNLADATDVKNIVTLLEAEAALNDDFMAELEKVENPYASTHESGQRTHGYILVLRDSIRVSSKAAAEAICKAGYADWDSRREYINNDGAYSVDSGIEYQFYTSARTYGKDKTTNKGFKGTQSEEIKESLNFRCRSNKTWIRYQIIWVLGDNGNVEFYVQATTNKWGTYRTTGAQDKKISEKLSAQSGVPAYTWKDISITSG